MHAWKILLDFICKNDDNLFYAIILSIGFRGQPFIIINKKRLDAKGNSVTTRCGEYV